MKLSAVLLVISLAGCASRVQPTQTITYEQLKNIQYTYRDCQRIDYHINLIETQLQSRGLLNVEPEQLNETDRMYNAMARVQIWNLRIDCNNKDRFAKK